MASYRVNDLAAVSGTLPRDAQGQSWPFSSIMSGGTTAEVMRRPYPELSETVRRVSDVIRQEEENFLSTVDAGLERIERFFTQMKHESRRKVSGAEAFEMYATHGFPPELFETMAAERSGV